MMFHSRISLALALSTLPFAVFAAGTDDTKPPTPTETTTECKDGLVWDKKKKECVEPVEGRLDDDTLFRAARELAWAGQNEAALKVLAAMQEGDSDRVLTYKGFANRKAGRVEEGMAFYSAALARNPDNILARSYMGQGLVEQGEAALARLQLDEIRARGGAGTWAEASLADAIRTGVTYSY